MAPRHALIMAVEHPRQSGGARSRCGEFCDRHGLYFFEDNCESMDAELADRKAGTFGAVNTFSFFFSHHISTMEGGMVLTDDEETAHLCKSIRAHGWTRDLPQGLAAVRAAAAATTSRPTASSCRATTCAPGDERRHRREQLKKLPGFTAGAARTWRCSSGCSGATTASSSSARTARARAFCFPIVLNPDLQVDRGEGRCRAARRRHRLRIITGGNFLRHDVIRYFDYEIHGGAAPNADIAHDNGFFVGNHPFDLSGQIEKLYRVLDKSC